MPHFTDFTAHGDLQAPPPETMPPLPEALLLTQPEIDALWQGNTSSWTGLIRQVESAVHLKLYRSTL